MFRRFATLVLLVPLAFNGMWMVCAGEQAAPEADKLSAATPEATPPCTTICPTQQQPQTGAICFLSSNGDGTSLAAFAFAVVAPPPAVSVPAAYTLAEWVPEQAAIYLNPTLPGLTPPPRA